MAEQVQTISCSDYRLEKQPSKHYSYELRIRWTDRETVIYRRYSQFFTLQCTLLDDFPIEAGTYDPERRIIPFLPGKKFIGNLTAKTAEKRKAKLDTYLKDLLDIKPIAQSQTFLNFCRTKEKDLERFTAKQDQSVTLCNEISEPLLLPQYRVVFDYQKCQKGEMSVAVGDTVLVIDKKLTGWWLAQSEDEESQGWVPASFLEPVNPVDAAEGASQLRTPDKYIAICDYDGAKSDELTVRLGAYVDVYKKSYDGWWSCSLRGTRGLLPAAYLCKVNSLKARTLQARKEKSQASSSSSKRRSLSKCAPPRPAHKPAKRSVRPPRPPPPITKKAEEFVAIADFTGSTSDSVSLIEGKTVKVITKDDSGWWFVDSNGKEGWAPSTYLQPH